MLKTWIWQTCKLIKWKIYKNYTALVENVTKNSSRRVKPTQPPPSVQSKKAEYELIRRSGNISTCVGCGQATLKQEHFVIRWKESDWFYHPTDKIWVPSKKTNRHYHCKRQCLLRRNPFYDYNMLKLDPNLDQVEISFLLRFL